ncbi:MAG: hypothetical protein V4692_03010, partial [Bdellovibrionota bacterium]
KGHTMKRIAALLIPIVALFLGACTCPSKRGQAEPTEAAAVSATATSEEAPTSIRGAFPKNLPEQSSKLLKVLQSTKLKPTQTKSHKIYRAYDITCRVTPPEGKTVCDLSDKVPDAPGRRVFKVSDAQSEELSTILFGLPVPQGDSGATASFIECWATGEGFKTSSCDIAINIDYPGP